MTKSEIKKYLQIIGYVNLILSLHYLIFSRENELIERIFAVIAINVGYHMMYFFFAGIYESSIPTGNHNEFNNNIRGIIHKIFATFGIFASIFLLSVFISNTICFDQYLNLYMICIPFGFFLGAYSLGTHLKNK
jgi:hypothetical protein